MATKCFLKNGAPFQCHPETGMPGLIKLKCANQRFGLGYKPKKDYYKWVTQIKREARMARIEGREPEEKVSHVKSAQHRLAIFHFVCVLIGSLESPPSI